MREYPSINEAKMLAKKYHKDGVVIFSFDLNGRIHGVSYGADRVTCQALGEWLDRLVDDYEEHGL